MSEWEETEKLLQALEKRIVDLESNNNKSSSSAASTDSELQQENARLKSKVARLEYRIQILTKELKATDNK